MYKTYPDHPGKCGGAGLMTCDHQITYGLKIFARKEGPGDHLDLLGALAPECLPIVYLADECALLPSTFFPSISAASFVRPFRFVCAHESAPHRSVCKTAAYAAHDEQFRDLLGESLGAPLKPSKTGTPSFISVPALAEMRAQVCSWPTTRGPAPFPRVDR
jgi:hypothetical protein